MNRLGQIKKNWDESDDSDAMVDTIETDSPTASRTTPKPGQTQTESDRGRPPVQSEDDDDGFQEVQNKRKRSRSNVLPTPDPSPQSKRPNIVYKPVSTPRPRSGTGDRYMKQISLPVDQRNSHLVLKEARKSPEDVKKEYVAGTIIRAILHEQHLGQEFPMLNKFETKSREFGLIYTKSRPMIVIGQYETHYVAIPLYTHAGRGLEQKRQKWEFVSIRDHRRPGNFNPLTEHQPLLTEFMKSTENWFSPVSTAHITYPVSRNYVAHCQIIGRLTKESLARLITLYQRYAPKNPIVAATTSGISTPP